MTHIEPVRSALAWLLNAGEGGAPAPGAPWTSESVRIAAENGVAGLCWQAVTESGQFESLEPEIREELHDARDREIALSLPFQGAVDRLLGAIGERDIPVIALKGLALRRDLYEQRGWCRGPGDIDLLVPRGRLEDARGAMQGIGLVPTTRYGPEFYERHHHIEPHRLPEFPSVLVDIHWTPVALPHPFELDLEAWWQRAKPLEDAEGVLRLDDVDQALHFCLQLDHDDAFAGKARTLFELAALSQRPSIDGHILAARANEVGGSEAVGRSYALVQSIFGSDPLAGVPQDPGPFGVRGTLWRGAVRRAVWRDAQRNAPAWYLQYCSRVLAGPGSLPSAIAALLKPIFANPRLGGRGFDAPH